MSQKIFLLTFEGNCVNFPLELNFFYFKSSSDLKTASQNRPNTYGPPCIKNWAGQYWWDTLYLANTYEIWLMQLFPRPKSHIRQGPSVATLQFLPAPQLRLH